MSQRAMQLFMRSYVKRGLLRGDHILRTDPTSKMPHLGIFRAQPDEYAEHVSTPDGMLTSCQFRNEKDLLSSVKMNSE